MKKIIVIPGRMDCFTGEKLYELLHSMEFSRLRDGFAKDLSKEEIEFLREGFEPFQVLTDSPLGKYFVEEEEEISVEMMEEASFEMTKAEVSS